MFAARNGRHGEPVRPVPVEITSPRKEGHQLVWHRDHRLVRAREAFDVVGRCGHLLLRGRRNGLVLLADDVRTWMTAIGVVLGEAKLDMD